MDWFYDYSIKISNKSYSGGCFIDGVYSAANNDAVVSSFTVDCDVQPVDTSSVDADAGVVIDAKYKVFMDKNSNVFNTSCIVYNDVEYRIVKIITWDDYMILYIKAVM